MPGMPCWKLVLNNIKLTSTTIAFFIDPLITLNKIKNIEKKRNGIYYLKITRDD